MDKQRATVIVSKSDASGSASGSSKTYSYDSVFDESSTQESVYEEAARPIVASVMEGYNGTILAYGQTGTGKTFTMEGESSPPELCGIIPRTFRHIFNEIENSSNDTQFLVRVSFIEIYNERIRDLLTPKSTENGEIHEHPDKGVYLTGVKQETVSSVEEITACLKRGSGARHVGETKMNSRSSRSHCIFSIIVETASRINPDAEEHIRVGKLNMVDLAGSERQSKTGSEGVRLVEAAAINLQLSALGNVIFSLTSSRSTHIPYRDSKLTRLIQDSLGGNTKTVMIANIGPASYNYDETIGTLRFASRAKKIENKPHINEDPKDALLRQYQDEIELLKKKLAETPEGGLGAAPGSGNSVLPVVVDKVVEKVVRKKGVSQAKVKELERRAQQEKQALTKKMLAERAEIEAITNKVEANTRKMAEQLKQKATKLVSQRKAREAMESKLKELTQNLVSGSTILNDAEKRQRDLERAKTKLAKKEAAQAKLENKLRKRETLHSKIAERFDSQEKHLESVNEQLEELAQQHAQLSGEFDEAQTAFQQEREELLELRRNLSSHLSLKQLTLNSFVPPQALQRALERAQWDSDTEQWRIEPLNLDALRAQPRPVSSCPEKRPHPITEFTRVARVLGDQDPRHRRDNVLKLSLALPERTTSDYIFEDEGPSGGYFSSDEENRATDPYFDQYESSPNGIDDSNFESFY